MVKMENDCVGCPDYCIGSACKYYYDIPHFYCDECGKETETLYKYDGDELCEDCILERLEAEEIDVEDECFNIMDYVEEEVAA